MKMAKRKKKPAAKKQPSDAKLQAARSSLLAELANTPITKPESTVFTSPWGARRDLFAAHAGFEALRLCDYFYLIPPDTKTMGLTEAIKRVAETKLAIADAMLAAEKR
jgi:hypothetical protein